MRDGNDARCGRRARHQLPGGAAPLTRRAVLGAGLAGAALLLGGRAAAAPGSPPAPTLVLENLHTGESLSVARNGDAAATGAALSHVLRDHRTGEEHAIDPALLELLLAVAAQCDCAPHFQVISGYRAPATNAALHARSEGVSEHSLHMQGLAIDVRLSACALVRLHAAALALGRGGVGYYPQSRFVHLDTGRVRSWRG